MKQFKSSVPNKIPNATEVMDGVITSVAHILFATEVLNKWNS